MILLVVGAELLVRGAVVVARAAGVSPLVIGLTVVAFGTSAPELATSLAAAIRGATELAIANVVGSNIFNVLVILGIAAVLTPIKIEARLLRCDLPLMVGVSVGVFVMALDGEISRLEGAGLALAIVIYTGWVIHASRRERPAVVHEFDEGIGPALWGGPWVAVVLVVTGLGLLVAGSDWLVRGASAMAAMLGISPRVIGLTVVAAGTSLPELATSVVAAVRGQRDIAVGNIVGSNLFNLLAVLGAAAVASPSGLGVSSRVVTIDLPVMVASAVVCLPVFYTGFEVSRREGLAFLIAFGSYAGWLVLDAKGRPLPGLLTLIFVICASLATAAMVIATIRQLRSK
jgi:cation:H+ antiporter